MEQVTIPAPIYNGFFKVVVHGEDLSEWVMGMILKGFLECQ
jgi:hypothetical protein